MGMKFCNISYFKLINDKPSKTFEWYDKREKSVKY